MRCANCNIKIGLGNYITYEDNCMELCDYDFVPNDEYGGEIEGSYYCQDCYEDELISRGSKEESE